MKKLLLLFALLLCCFVYSKAADFSDTTKVDTAKINKKIRNLQEDLADYNSGLSKAQTRLPADSVAFVNAASKANDALKASKKAASNAVGGDVSDARNAEKKAKKASDAKDDAHDAEKQLKNDKSDIRKYTKKIQKTQKKIDHEIKEMISDSVDDLADEDGWTFLGELGSLIIKKQPDFDPRNYGYVKMLPLIRSLNKYEIDERDTGKKNVKHIYIRKK